MKPGVLILLLLVPVAFGCQPAEQAARTDTIAPAEPPSGSATEDSTVLTQTTEVGEDRSPNEGGVLADQSEAPATATTTSPDRPR